MADFTGLMKIEGTNIGIVREIEKEIGRGIVIEDERGRESEEETEIEKGIGIEIVDVPQVEKETGGPRVVIEYVNPGIIGIEAGIVTVIEIDMEKSNNYFYK